MRKTTKSSAAGMARAVDAPMVHDLCLSCEEALRPISNQFLELGFGVSMFLHVAKRAYVQAAVAAIKRTGQRVTDSRVAAITGLQRKEIRLLSQTSPEDESLVARLPPTMRVIAAWQSDSTFRDRSGRPKPIDLEGSNSFRTLVERYAGDVTHVAILRELERLKWIIRTPNGQLEIQKRTAEMKAKTSEVGKFASHIADYASALNGVGRAFDSKGYSGHRESVPTDRRVGAALTTIFSRRAEEFLNSFDRWVSRSQKQSQTSEVPGAATYGIGVYLVEREVQASQARKEAKSKAIRPSSRAKRA
jgi:uncharacterized protein DUF6502